MAKRKIHSKSSLLSERRELRQNQTEAENILWDLIRNRKLQGKRFKRQHSIETYIVDFFCPQEKLIIELDGQHHFTEHGKQQDHHRDMHLVDLGFKVLRFENHKLLNNPETVLQEITSHFYKS
jgi:very-short-patch-repair endonuclease